MKPITGPIGYFVNYISLMLLLALTVGLSRVDLGAFHMAVGLFIAGLKAFLILLFFMHVWRREFLWVLLSGFAVFVLSVTALTLTDFIMRQ